MFLESSTCRSELIELVESSHKRCAVVVYWLLLTLRFAPYKTHVRSLLVFFPCFSPYFRSLLLLSFFVSFNYFCAPALLKRMLNTSPFRCDWIKGRVVSRDMICAGFSVFGCEPQLWYPKTITKLDPFSHGRIFKIESC
jgi:hypothetical protein